MKDIDRLEEFLFKAVQAGKQETSNLVTDINKKIEIVTERLDTKIDHLTNEVKLIKENIAELKEDIKPIDDTRTWFKISKEWAVYWAQFLTPFVVIGGIITAIYKHFK